MNPKTANFNIVSDPKLACTCGNPKCDKRAIKQIHLTRVQFIRDDAKRPLTVRSGGRCQYHPDELHRTTPADHQKRNGIDIAVSGGVERGQIVHLGLIYGFNAIGIAKTFVHLGYRENEELVMWTY